MKLAFAAVLLVSCLVGCGQDRSITLPPPIPTTVYSATLSASSACAGKLPAGEAVRVYEVTSAGGFLLWKAATVTQSRADQRSSLKVDGNTVSLVIGSGWFDQQDDIFYGIREDLGGARELTIYGQGNGHVEGSSMTGTFEGDFESWGTNVPSVTCHAADHHFTFAPRRAALGRQRMQPTVAARVSPDVMTPECQQIRREGKEDWR